MRYSRKKRGFHGTTYALLRLPINTALNAMRQKLYLYIRFFIYGLISFVIFGVFLEAPAIGVREISYKLVVYLGLAGGFSMMFSCISAHILFGFIKDLIYGNN